MLHKSNFWVFMVSSKIGKLRLFPNFELDNCDVKLRPEITQQEQPIFALTMDLSIIIVNYKSIYIGFFI